MTIKFDKDGFALESGNATVYLTDSNGIYIRDDVEFVTIGTGVSAGAYLDKPPKNKIGFAIVRNDNGWEYQPDHRGKTVYCKQTQAAKQIQDLGDLPSDCTATAPPDHYHTWNGKEWVLSDEQYSIKLTDIKDQKLIEINTKAQAFVSKVAGLDKVPEYEVKTWQIQGKEAKAWHADETALTPNLDAIAAARGIPADVLKGKAYEKTVKFEMLTAVVAGLRQGYEDANKAAKTPEEVAAINPIYKMPVVNNE